MGDVFLSMVDTKKIAFVFPGQGSQFEGMGQDLYEQNELARRFFHQADELLGFSLSKLCFEGPESELTRTSNTQPALYVCSVVSYELLKERGLVPSIVTGHSLGEYAALYAAGVYDFVTGLRLVRKRGELMQEADTKNPGSMAAVIGLDSTALEQICFVARQETGQTVNPANYNSPQQIVISGARDAVDAAMKLAQEQGAKRVIPLKVSAAFHSKLMNYAVDEFREFLAQEEFRDACIPFINNVDAMIINNADDIRDSLVRQLTNCVRWVESIQKMINMGYKCFIEAGPGKVLSSLIKQIDRSVKTYHAGTIEWIDTICRELE